MRRSTGGLSRRRAAERFGVGVSSAVCWVSRCKRSGHLEPGKRGGDRRCHRIDGHRDRILALIEDQPDLCLGESAERLDAETGYRALPSVVCRFFERHGIRRKKGRRMPANNSARMSCDGGSPGSTHGRILIQIGLFLVMNAARPRRWRGSMDARPGQNAAMRQSLRDCAEFCA